MSITIRHISNFLNQWAPPGIKLDYDNVGLLVGNPVTEVTGILTCLDVTEDVVSEARKKKCNLIVAHHPLIFNKIGSINPTNEQGRIIYELIKNDIGLLVAHTNLDAALDGVSFVLANMLGLDNLRFLEENYPISRKIRLTTDFPKSEDLLGLLNYYSAEDAVYYPVKSKKQGIHTYEAIIDEHNVRTLETALKKEGILKRGSLQIVELASPSQNFGMGVLGEYPDEGLQPEAFLHLVSKALDLKAIRFSGSASTIKKVAVCGGAGVKLKEKAFKAGTQAFVTADVKYHDFFNEHSEFMLVDVGHYESEAPVIDALRKELSDAFESLNVFSTTVITNPMRVYVPFNETKTIH